MLRLQGLEVWGDITWRKGQTDVKVEIVMYVIKSTFIKYIGTYSNCSHCMNIIIYMHFTTVNCRQYNYRFTVLVTSVLTRPSVWSKIGELWWRISYIKSAATLLVRNYVVKGLFIFQIIHFYGLSGCKFISHIKVKKKKFFCSPHGWNQCQGDAN